MDIVERVYNYILSHQMIVPGDSVLVAVSGGADSITLLHVLKTLQKRLNVSLSVAHLDHMLRGEESKKDAQFVKKLCEEWKIPCTTEAKDVGLYQQQNRLSTEVAAREVRYDFLNQVAKKYNAKRIALGHHADDQAETVLLNLLRGTGTTGLAGMLPLRGNKYIRPLLAIRRYEIEQYCRANGLDYQTDSSNKELVYLRNKLRLSLIPLLEEKYNREIVTALGRLANLSREEDNYIDQQARQVYESLINYSQPKILTININAFNSQHVALKRRLIRMIWTEVTGGNKGLAYQHVQSVLAQCTKSQPSEIKLPGGVLCKIAYGKMTFAYAKDDGVDMASFSYPLQVPGKTYLKELGLVLETKIHYAEEKVINPRELPTNEAVFDYEKTGNALYVRNRSSGDRFTPQGTTGTVKLKKFLIDQKVPQEKRSLIPLICSKNEIIWVSGLRVGEYWKVTDATKKILHINIKKYS